MKEYKDELISKAEALITTGFPEKIVQLNELLATQMFADRNFDDVYQVSIAMSDFIVIWHLPPQAIQRTNR